MDESHGTNWQARQAGASDSQQHRCGWSQCPSSRAGPVISGQCVPTQPLSLAQQVQPGSGGGFACRLDIRSQGLGMQSLGTHKGVTIQRLPPRSMFSTFCGCNLSELNEVAL